MIVTHTIRGKSGSRHARAMRLAASLIALIAAAQTAEAADFRLPANDYGKVVLPVHESLGDAAREVVDRQNVFEPVGLLRDDDPIRLLTRAVGRLDLKVEEDGKQFLSTCTATIVEGNMVLTNYHCIPGFTGRVLEASILLDYYGSDSKTTRIPVETMPVEKDPKLDYSLTRLAGLAPADLVPVPISHDHVQPLERLTLIHHPAGQPKMMTSFRCYAAPNQGDGKMLRHRCDTLPGSSGALIFDINRHVVGLHHSGGLSINDPASFNEGSNMGDILDESQLLRTSVDASTTAGTPGVPAVSAAGSDRPSAGSGAAPATEIVTDSQPSAPSRADAGTPRPGSPADPLNSMIVGQ
ncbi:serine protease [Aurantimonas sp. VKM B-3413]|uniref:S1 family peptidase n=1 Tax=Aurantimonas sp. VKM B-3413 TaxID=2779401 RepID=UPI001E343407|nr:serine protease [Aurantimonas sp. VKM B-3413]MCB8837756.1 serine protease [Aurantimonas sp. VKM B-3413]